MVALLFTLSTSIWIWKIIFANFLLGILVFATSFLLYKQLTNAKPNVWLIFAFLLLLASQYQSTTIKPLTSLTKQEEVIKIQRLKEYPPTYVQFDSKTLWIPAAHWLEGRRESVILMHLGQNVAEVLDPNLYFFSNHPRERVGVDEFEKFSYLLLPFFLYGTYLFIKEKRWLVLSYALILLLLLTLIGNNNPLGPFSLLPFFVVTISYGMQKTYETMKYFSPWIRYTSLVLFLLVFSLVLVQLISYELA